MGHARPPSLSLSVSLHASWTGLDSDRCQAQWLVWSAPHILWCQRGSQLVPRPHLTEVKWGDWSLLSYGIRERGSCEIMVYWIVKTTCPSCMHLLCTALGWCLTLLIRCSIRCIKGQTHFFLPPLSSRLSFYNLSRRGLTSILFHTLQCFVEA